MDDKIKKVINEYEKHSKKNGFKLNPNKKIVENLIIRLLENEEKFGKRYCPCKMIHSDEIICPCANHKTEIEKQGYCHCFLFVSINFSEIK